MNFKNFITALIATLLLFVIDVQESDSGSVYHELEIANFDSLPESQAAVILNRIQRDLDRAGISQVDLHTQVNGSLSISYSSALSPAVVLELFKNTSNLDAREASVQELLVHEDLNIVVKEIAPAGGIPTGCDGVLSQELKTDADRNHAGQRLLALSNSTTLDDHLYVSDSALSANFYKDRIISQRQVSIPDSRAGPVI